MDENGKLPKVKSRALGEAAGGSLGMLSGLAIGAALLSLALPYGWLACAAAALLGLFLLLLLMVGGSILGGMVRF
jgi:hypothetical protein